MTRKEQIVDAAIQLFSAESFESVGIQKLAAASGVAQGLLYRHFKSKNDLLLHLLMKGMEQVQHTLQPYAIKEFTFEQAFAEHINLTFKYLRSNYKLWKILHSTRQNAALMNSLELDKGLIENIIGPMKDKMTEMGIPKPGIKAWHIFSLVDGITSLYLAHPDLYPLKKMERFLKENVNFYASF